MKIFRKIDKMIIYYICFSYCLLLACWCEYKYHNNNIIGNSKKKLRKKFIIEFLVFIPLWLIMGLRYYIGADYGNYLRISKGVMKGKISDFGVIEFGYLILNKIIVTITHNEYSIFLLVSFIIVGIYIYIIFNKTASYPIGLIVYLTMGYFFNAMNGQRQFIAISIVFFTITRMEKKRYIEMFIMLGIATVFHKSAIIMFVVCLSVLLIKDKFFYSIVFLAVVSIRIYSNLFITWLANSNTFSYGQKYVSHSITGTRISIPNILISMMILIMCVFNRKILISKQNTIYFKLCYIAFLCFMILNNFGVAVTRVCFYFTSVYIILIPEILRCFRKKSFEYYLSRCILIIVCYGYLYFLLKNSVVTSNNFYPYCSVLSI